MATNSDIVTRTAEFVSTLFKEKLPPWVVYHTFDHTAQTVEACREIGSASRLNKSEMEVAVLAAWLHDTGYVESHNGHEQKSADIAADFLKQSGYPQERIDLVMGCILATAIPQRPKNLIEQVVCDADIVHIGKKSLFEKSELLRLEQERIRNGAYSDAEWLNINIDFVANNQFHTPYAKSEFTRRRIKNLVSLQEQLRAAVAKQQDSSGKLEIKKQKLASKLEKESRPERGIETMFRVVPSNHLNLSSLADQKANIMISTNAIIISIVVGLLVSKLDTNPHLVIPTLILIGVCLLAMIFAILATRPKVTSGTFTKEDIQQKRANLLFFGNFHSMTLQDFEWGMKEMMNDREYLYGSMIRDLYFLGQVLGQKYRYLRICYTIFMYGLVVAVAAFVIAFISMPHPAP
jgi:predicted metal-dependent HD superfamily phosphohydrolase